MNGSSASLGAAHARRNPSYARAILITLALALALFGALSSTFVSNSHAAPIVTADEDGANDEPGQKDLTRHSIDTAGLPTSLAVTWNWDEISWNGNNTGDGCSLFDTDGDALVNYALCVTVGGSPAAVLSTRLYSCGDDKVDRCTQPVTQILTFGSTCSVATSNTDPFPTGDAYPQDTTASCNVVMTDFGVTSARLINTCSYPSQEPNSDPSDCVLVPRDGFLVIQKNASPNNPAALFDFTLDGNVVFTAHGTETSLVIGVRTDQTHSLSETSIPSLWSLQSASCSPATGTFANPAITGISVAADSTVTCTFNNLFTPSAPQISTQASATVAVGSTISDTATLSGAFNPTGTITYNLYGPNDATCATSIYTTSMPVNGNGSYVAPSFTTTQAGTYRWVASYGGDANNSAANGSCNDANESVVVSKASPQISTQASAPVTIGSSIADTATLAGGYNPTGTITYRLYGPNDATCATVIYTTTKSVSGNGSYVAASFTPTQAGTYRWIASYGGDVNNNVANGSCNDSNESVVVGKASPQISTQASAPVTVGSSIADTATLSGGYNPTGSITFNLYGPNDATCATSIYTTSTAVSGNAAYQAASFTPTQAGTYRWIASYGGDVNNNAANGSCNDANESVVVGKASPQISTQASAPVTVGSSIADTATLAGGYNPTGTITYRLYGPNDATCATSIYTTTKSVSGNGSYVAASFTPTQAGTYRWIASYGGDVNNNVANGSCNDSNESVVVGKASPQISTQASPTVVVGSAIYDTATLSGGYNPTGTITFNLYGPNDATCATSIYTTSAAVSGNGSYVAPSYTATQAGTYRWIASYGGDVNNNTANGACNDANESVVVSLSGPSISTQASAPVTIGSAISDTANLSGTFSGTGTITFHLYGPNDATCATSIYTTTKSVSGNGSYVAAAFTPTQAGTYRWIASYGGDVNNSGANGSCNDANESVVVGKASPQISTQASAPVTVGSSIADTATLSGGYNPTGTITYHLYGPNDATCATSIYTTTKTVNGNGSYVAASFTPTQAGTYRWIASYGGDVNNNVANGACNDANESVVVSKASPQISTQASAPVTVGSTISDTATLSGGYNPTGTITFNLYGPNDATCATSIYMTTKSVSGNGAYVAAAFTTTQAGTYRWIASYGGDVNNNTANGACNDSNESVVVGKASPQISTQASAPVTVGSSIADTATLSGGYNPTGTITYHLYGPNDATCATSIYTTTKTVNGNGSYLAASFTPTQAGTYRWIASYGGDVNNNTANGSCNDANESVVVGKASPQISTEASPTVVVGSAIYDTATLSGGYNPTGTITFHLYGPNDATCATSIYTTSAAVSGNGSYVAPSYTATQAGTYRWVASYGGDVNNNTANGACNDANESVVVSLSGPSISTQASAPVTIGSSISDTANLSGTFSGTGTITFHLYGPNDATCVTSIYTTTSSVAGNGSYVAAAFTPTQAGTYRWIASYGGDVNNSAANGSCNDANESVVVGKASPQISTQASAPVTIGSAIADTATLAGGYNPTGTITFHLYGPNDATCATSIYTTTKTVNGNGSYLAASFTPTQAGTYRWIASYGGDVNNNTANGACNDANESVVIGKASPQISTQASAPVTIGSAIADTATLAGGYNPTGTITFHLYGPNDATCATSIYTTTKTVNGNGSYLAASFTPTQAGTYRWIASYGGDVNNNTANGACNDANESVVIGKASPQISTQASPTVTVGSPIFDTATLSGAYSATGTITFRLYGPNDATCETVIYTTTKTVNGNGSYQAASFTANQAGTYRWIASYGGDVNNNTANGACNDANESLVVNEAVPQISTQASGSVDVGATISDTATLSGGFNPTGSITFKLYGPNDANCATAILTQQVAVQGNGDYVSPSVTATLAGTYRWIASYSGDGNNLAATGHCNDEGESVVVTNPAISLTKTVSADSVAPGTTVTFTLTVKNTGDIPLTDVALNDNTCSPLSSPTGDAGSDSILGPNEVWTYTCSMVINIDTTNVATVSAIDRHENKVSAQASASVVVLPVVAPASVELKGEPACVSKRLKIAPKVSGASVETMTLYVDGKRKGSRSSGAFVINTAKYKPGRHKIRVVTELTNGQTIITSGSFTRCSLKTTQRRITPHFTG